MAEKVKGGVNTYARLYIEWIGHYQEILLHKKKKAEKSFVGYAIENDHVKLVLINIGTPA